MFSCIVYYCPCRIYVVTFGFASLSSLSGSSIMLTSPFLFFSGELVLLHSIDPLICDFFAASCLEMFVRLSIPCINVSYDDLFFLSHLRNNWQISWYFHALLYVIYACHVCFLSNIAIISFTFRIIDGRNSRAMSEIRVKMFSDRLYYLLVRHRWNESFHLPR